MDEEGENRSYLKKIVPRVLKAVIWGLITLVLVYFLPTYIFPIETVAFRNPQDFYVFAAITVFFVVAIKLLSKTIFEHAFRIAKVLFTMIYFIIIFEGGIVRLDIPVEATTMSILIDLRVILVMLISPSLLALSKSLLQTMDFLFRKSEACH